VRWLRRRPVLADSIPALVVTLIGIAAHWHVPVPAGGHQPNALGTVLVCLAGLPLALRRRHPFAVLATVAAAQFTIEAIGFESAGWIGIMIALYTVAAHTSGVRRAYAAEAFAVGALGLLIAGLLKHRIDVGTFISSIVFLVGAFILGDNLQRRRLNVAELAERAERAERERELMSRQRVQDERSRIARELHDVVAHSVSLMIIQAGAARRSISSAPLQAESALKDLETTGRQAMDELRRVLGVLRTENVDGNALAPQPSLSTVRSLVDSDPSLPVELHETGAPPADVPSSVGLSMYRVVQEALTNVRKHAGAVRQVAINVAYEADRVVVQITDDGRGASVATNADGHGLVGMRERMALCGGTVVAGPRPGGGWQVRATAPLAEVS